MTLDRRGPAPVIVTLTPNPSVDRTVELTSALQRGAVLRSAASSAQAAGKGVNISRAAVAAGLPTIAVLPADPEDPYVLELLAAGIDCRPEPTSGGVRTNLTITEPDGTTTKINSPGATAGPELLGRLRTALGHRSRGAAWVVLAGSLPPGAPDDWYATLVADLVAGSAEDGHDARALAVAVDTSGAPLQAVAAHLPVAAPALMKPNAEELASLTGADPDAIEADPVAAARAAATLVERGVGAVLATLGAGGAVLVTAEGSWHATPPPTAVVSTVGAGDSSLFGYLLGALRGEDAPGRLRLAVAYGSAAAGLPGTTIPTPDHVSPELVDVAELPVPTTT
ncbi:MAG: 1-phosphofructokinase family hexose kinase [Actinomycetes bacterium]